MGTCDDATMLIPRQQQRRSHGRRRPGSPAGRQWEQTGCVGRRWMRLPPRRWNRLGPARHRRQPDLRCVRQRETRSELHWVRQRECPRNCQLSACLQFRFSDLTQGIRRRTGRHPSKLPILTDGRGSLRERWLAGCWGRSALFSFPL